jgi:hypothetical protein
VAAYHSTALNVAVKRLYTGGRGHSNLKNASSISPYEAEELGQILLSQT